MLLTAACNQSQHIQLVQTKTLPFPSASAIEYYPHKLFVFGDDAPYVVITDTAFQVLDTIAYLPGTDRIPKYSKPDIEAAFIDSMGGAAYVEAWSSGSAPNRNYRLRIHAATGKLTAIDSFSYRPFLQQLPSIPEVNVEGATRISTGWLAANRANLSQPVTWFLFWKEAPFTQPPQPKELQLNMPPGAGVSALAYQQSKDRLFFVVSEEATASTTGDGAIGESWLCWINRFSEAWRKEKLQPSAKMKLSGIHPSLRRQKVEGITLQTQEENLHIYLCADNDDGLSSFFHLRWMGGGK